MRTRLALGVLSADDSTGGSRGLMRGVGSLAPAAPAVLPGARPLLAAAGPGAVPKDDVPPVRPHAARPGDGICQPGHRGHSGPGLAVAQAPCASWGVQRPPSPSVCREQPPAPCCDNQSVSGHCRVSHRGRGRDPRTRADEGAVLALSTRPARRWRLPAPGGRCRWPDGPPGGAEQKQHPPPPAPHNASLWHEESSELQVIKIPQVWGSSLPSPRLPLATVGGA